MKISILCFDLSHNCLYRPYLLAKVLKRRYDIEIIGPKFGEEIWKPCDTGEFQYKSVKGRRWPFFISSAIKMLKFITGDVIYAVCARPTSFGIGLVKKISSKLPLVLDVLDWEVGFYLSNSKFGYYLKPFLLSLPNLLNPNCFLYTLAMEKLIRFADDVTTLSTFLQSRFGGIIVQHGRDTKVFDPSRFNHVEMKKKWSLTDKKIIMFFGTPGPHKGVEELVQAVKSLHRDDIILMIVGAHDGEYTRKLKKLGGDKLRMEGMQPFSKVPEFLSMADLVAIPQRNEPSAIGQVPAKLFDAMAMAKPIIATKVSDIPVILEGCGLIVEPENALELSDKISFFLENEDVAKKLGERAREKCIEEYSWSAMEKILVGVFSKYE